MSFQSEESEFSIIEDFNPDESPFEVEIEREDWREQLKRMIECLLEHQYYKGHLRKIKVEEFVKKEISKGNFKVDYEKQAEVFKRFQQEALKKLENIKSKLEGVKVLKAVKMELERLKTAHPIYAKKYEILDLLKKEQIITVIGATSSGKSTQIIQYLLEMEGFDKKIALGEPRRHLVEHLAKTIKKECDEEMVVLASHSNHLVGEENAKLEFHTHKSLIQALIADEKLSGYSCLIIDEAHERYVESDILISLVKKTLRSNKDLKVIITSATANQAIFDKLFEEQVPRIQIAGTTYEVEKKYIGSFEENKGKTENKVHDIIEESLKVLEDGSRDEFGGDVLIFVAGVKEVDHLIDFLSPIYGESFNILPFHGRLNKEDKAQVWKRYSSKPKLIVSTRYAETGLTLANLKVVIDCGYDLSRTYIRETHVTEEEIKKISQSSADQRAGRTGRTCNGVCYRLYSKDDYDKLEKYEKSAMKSYHYYNAIMLLKGMKVKDVASFEFVEELTEKDKKDLKNDIRFLELMNILGEDEELLPLGKVITQSPFNPIEARILYEAMRWDCIEPVINILGLYSKDWTLFGRGGDAKEIKKRFHSDDGAFMMLCNISDEYENQTDKESWLIESGLDRKSFSGACDFIEEAKNAINRARREKVIEVEVDKDVERMSRTDRILRCFLQGYWFNLCVRKERVFKLPRLNKYMRVNAHDINRRIDFLICDGVGKFDDTLHAQVYSRINKEWLNDLSAECLAEIKYAPTEKKVPSFHSLRNQENLIQRNSQPLQRAGDKWERFKKFDQTFCRGPFSSCQYQPKGFINIKHSS